MFWEKLWRKKMPQIRTRDKHQNETVANYFLTS